MNILIEEDKIYMSQKIKSEISAPQKLNYFIEKGKLMILFDFAVILNK